MCRRRSWSLAIVAVAALTFLTPSARSQGQPFDILIRRGTLVDGSGARPSRNDVAIRNGRVVSIGQLSNATAREVIDATGLSSSLQVSSTFTPMPTTSPIRRARRTSCEWASPPSSPETAAVPPST